MPRKSQLFKIDKKAKDQLEALKGVSNISAIKEFCIAFIQYAQNNNLQYMTRSQLIDAQKGHTAVVVEGQKQKKMATSPPVISERISKLIEIGSVFVYPDEIEIDGKTKSYRVHLIKDLSPLIKFITDKKPERTKLGRPRNRNIKMINDSLSNKGLIHLRSEKNLVAHSQGAFAILLASCKSGGDKDNVIEAEYKFTTTDKIKIKTTTSSDADIDILHISDNRIMIALNGMLRRENLTMDDMFGHAPARMVNGYCFFDIFALTKEIGLQPNKQSNRIRVENALKRLFSTTFSVDATDSPFWREHYMPNSSFTKGSYRYITELYTAKDWNHAEHKDPEHNEILMDECDQRYYVVKFHPLISTSMETGKHAFITHPELKTERYDLPHLINNWVKGVVGVSKLREYPKGHHQYTIDIFGERCAPTIRVDNFERSFYSLARRQDKKEDKESHSEAVRFKYDERGEWVPEGTFWLNGYYFKVEINESLARSVYRKTRTMRRHRIKVYPVLTIWRDKEDPLVGDQSDHNNAVARQYALLTDTTDS